MLNCLMGCNKIEKIHYVADRCSKDFLDKLYSIDNDKLLIKEISDNFVGRRTSTMRNIGYTLAKLDFDKINGVLFIDGDRYFTTGSVESIDESIINNIPIEMIRNLDDHLLDEFKSQILNMFYSACVYLPKDVCLKLENHNYKGLLWNEDLESIWGIEDLFMGNQLNILGIDYIFNKNIILNNSEMTGYSNDNDVVKNMVYLMDAIVKYKEYINS